MKVSLGWINNEGYSEYQEKSFDDESSAFQFCLRNINRIARINGMRFHRDFEDVSEADDDVIKEISEDVILAAIRDTAK